MSWNFNPNEHEPTTGFQRQAEGDYTAVIKKSNAYANRERTGMEGIKLTVEFLSSDAADGPANMYAGKTYDIELGVMSANDTQNNIANGNLSAICIVTQAGAFQANFDANNNPVVDMFAPSLHDKPFAFSVIHTTSDKTQDDGTVKTSTYANIRNIRTLAGMDAKGSKSPVWRDNHPAGGSASGGGQTQQQTQPTQQQQQPAQQPTQQPQTQQGGGWGGNASSQPANVQPPAEQPQQTQQTQQPQGDQGGQPGWGGQAQGGQPSWGGA